MLPPMVVLWAAVVVQAPDSATRARYASALHAVLDSVTGVQAASVAFRADLATASGDLVIARAHRLRVRCAGARRIAERLALLLASGGYSERTKSAAARARHDLAELQRVLAQCERTYDTGPPAPNADSLRAWAPFRLTQLEAQLKRHVRGVQEFQARAGIR